MPPPTMSWLKAPTEPDNSWGDIYLISKDPRAVYVPTQYPCSNLKTVSVYMLGM